ncbi:hypothetical protein CCH79_00018962 [Gambusia affinis]|uniref:Kazal-like domain-containing protein n=1 Tax=Gambusia affinis TaxID=33528 RepID=A0A315VFJ0_GAMAF|nr:hypothetical protein CCH79_00018962 [Gambusia affinis]
MWGPNAKLVIPFTPLAKTNRTRRYESTTAAPHPYPRALKNPCAEVTCSYGSTCVQSSDGLSAKCMCPLSCDGKPDQMVCGSDGKDYRNECELHQQACKNQKNIRVQFQGPCDPCKDSENSLNTICRVQAVTRQPQFYMPPESCRPESEPLCASDGHTYPSECAMKATGLQKSISLRKIHSGACGKLEVCREDCLFNAVCVVEQSGARCSCDHIECDDTYKPLCSVDGHTFPNSCWRRKAECLSKSLIRTKQPGPCGEWSPQRANITSCVSATCFPCLSLVFVVCLRGRSSGPQVDRRVDLIRRTQRVGVITRQREDELVKDTAGCESQRATRVSSSG